MPTVEWSVRAADGTRHLKPNEERARKAAEELNAHAADLAERLGSVPLVHQRRVPWRVESREVTAWKPA